MQAPAMLAYIFWHRPFAHVDREAYEAAIVRFQRDLAAQPPPGFIATASYRIDPVPWLSGQPGYEDWYLIEASWAIDPLNGFAITGPRQPSHDHVAALADEGWGGLYAHVGGQPSTAEESTVYWLTRPRGIDWQAALEPARAQCPSANIWRRQMVLGPAMEFAVEAPDHAKIAAPSGWQSRSVKRVRLRGPS
jgi:hypothetical protein